MSYVKTLVSIGGLTLKPLTFTSGLLLWRVACKWRWCLQMASLESILWYNFQAGLKMEGVLKEVMLSIGNFKVSVCFYGSERECILYKCLTREHVVNWLQEEDLRQIFLLTVEVLQEFSRREHLSAQMSSVFQRYLALANHVLSWNFLPPNHILPASTGWHVAVVLCDFCSWGHCVSVGQVNVLLEEKKSLLEMEFYFILPQCSGILRTFKVSFITL